MNKDIELLIQVRGVYQNMPRREAVKIVAKNSGLTVKGVSGRVTRAEQTIAGRVALMQWQQDNTLAIDTTREEIDALINEHCKTTHNHKALLSHNKPHYAVFLADTHFPYHDVQALSLAYEIIADLPDVAYISGLNDGFDFSTLSRWPDGRKVLDRALDNDLRGVLDTYTYHLDTLAQIAPNALILALVGNHDVRLLNGNNGTEDYLQLEVMKRLADHGLMFLRDFSKENVVKITDTLIWYHGNHARKNRMGGAKANYETVKHHLQSKQDFTLVFGHVHDSVHYKNIRANAYGAGCLCRLQPHYTRHAQQWTQGMVVSKFTRDWDLTYNIDFDRVGDKLTAFNPFNGKEYEV